MVMADKNSLADARALRFGSRRLLRVNGGDVSHEFPAQETC